jgi:hypothetical protein
MTGTRKPSHDSFAIRWHRCAGSFMRLVTFRHAGIEEIGALTNVDSRIVRLQAAEELRGGKPNPDFQSMLAFLRGASASPEAAAQTIEFAVSQRPEGIVLDRAAVELLSPVPRPESIREFMVFEEHVINCTRRFEMPQWRASLDRMVEKTFGRKATLAYRKARPWYERPVYYKGNRMNVVGDGARHEKIRLGTGVRHFPLQRGPQYFQGKRERIYRRLYHLQRFLSSRYSRPRDGRAPWPGKGKRLRRR